MEIGLNLNYNYKIHLIVVIVGLLLGVKNAYENYDVFCNEETFKEQYMELEDIQSEMTEEEFIEMSKNQATFLVKLIPYMFAVLLNSFFFYFNTINSNKKKSFIAIIFMIPIFVIYMFLSIFVTIPLFFYDIYKIIIGLKNKHTKHEKGQIN